MKAIILSAKNSIRRPSLRRGFLLMPLLLACFGLAPMAQAVGPDTDGTIPGSNNGEGIGVLVSRTSGVWNSGTGFEALNHLTSGNQNTATGLRALFSDINGGYNTATGVLSLFSNTSGFFNSATGAYSLSHNTIGNYNTANGYSALYHNTEGEENTATGFGALYLNTADQNTANGHLALNRNTISVDNCAFGSQALLNNDSSAAGSGNGNNAFGFQALTSNVDGETNNAFGTFALFSNVSGVWNNAFGFSALASSTGDFNTAVGDSAGTTIVDGNNNVCVGNGAGNGIVSADNQVAIGVPALGPFADISNTCFIGSIHNQPVSDGGSGQDVFVDQFNVLGFLPSSRRFKHDIKPMDKASEVILALKPVTYKYNGDKEGPTQHGVIAEEVAEVAPDLVFRDKNGDVQTVRFDQIGAMLLNEFLKEHRKNEEQEATIARQQKQIEALTTGLQKVSDQLELAKPAQRTVVENR